MTEDNEYEYIDMTDEEIFEEYLDMKTEQVLKALGIPVDAKNLLNAKYHLEEIFDDGFEAGLDYGGFNDEGETE